MSVTESAQGATVRNMISSPMSLGFRSASNVLLMQCAQEDRVAVAERWQDDASEAAVNGNPQRARHVEDMIGHLLYGER